MPSEEVASFRTAQRPKTFLIGRMLLAFMYSLSPTSRYVSGYRDVKPRFRIPLNACGIVSDRNRLIGTNKAIATMMVLACCQIHR
jgi:hypothetical protein